MSDCLGFRISSGYTVPFANLPVDNHDDSKKRMKSLDAVDDWNHEGNYRYTHHFATSISRLLYLCI